MISALSAIAAGTLGIVGYYAYEGANYVKTDDARVAANTVFITPEITGRILEWNIREGDLVKVDDVLGRQDMGAIMTSAAINPNTMAAAGGIIAEKAQFKSPIAGQVIQSSAVVGQMAAPGTSLAVIADVSNLYVSANIKEDQVGRVKVGEDVDVKIDALPGMVFRGQIESMSRATASTFSLISTQNSSGNYTKVTQVIPVKIHLLATGGAQLMVGMNADIRIHIAGKGLKG